MDVAIVIVHHISAAGLYSANRPPARCSVSFIRAAQQERIRTYFVAACTSLHNCLLCI